MELADRTIVITGAGSGIGAALARRFAQEGPKALVLADLNLEGAQAVAREVGGEAV
jgi:NAD(P)-dependent dehydrogenase (short-subunit alcohol dehydrogenase family)